MITTREESHEQEKAIAKRIGSKLQSNSGATKFNKGDIVSSRFLVEAKTSMTIKDTFTVKKQWLEKLQEEQFAMNKDFSALVFDFGNHNWKETYYIINEKTFKLLKDLLEE